MRCFVLNRDQDTDRLKGFRDAWNAPWQFERFEAVDGSRSFIPECWQHAPGLFGLTASYILLFAALIRENLQEPVAIFEDDAMPAANWWSDAELALAEAPKGWWHINLGPHTARTDYPQQLLASPRLIRLNHAWQTHGVIYNPKKLGDHMLMLGEKPWPVDQVWCHLMIHGNGNFYATRKFLCGTRGGISSANGMSWPAFVGLHGQGLGGPTDPKLG